MMKQTQLSLKRSFSLMAGAIAMILLIPVLAQWDWTVGDYILMGVLLSTTGSLLVLAARYVQNRAHRIFVMMAIITVLLILWAELAVGVFGSPIAGS